jgi:hypothetical protein
MNEETLMVLSDSGTAEISSEWLVYFQMTSLKQDDAERH